MWVEVCRSEFAAAAAAVAAAAAAGLRETGKCFAADGGR